MRTEQRTTFGNPEWLRLTEHKTIVVLDTAAARQLCYGNVIPDWAKIFQKMRKDDYIFTLAECTFGELSTQITEKRLSALQVNNMKLRLQKFIHRALPILPGEIDVLRLIGSEPSSDSLLPEISRKSKSCWEMLFCPHQGKRIDATPELNEERESWRNALSTLEKKVGSSADDLDELDDVRLEDCFSHISGDIEIDPPISFRLDLRTRYLWRQFVRSKKRKEPYNPNSESKRNDGIDFNLYTFLALPAFIVTEDKGFFGGIQNICSYQKAWIKKPAELAESWSNKTLKRPAWDDAKMV